MKNKESVLKKEIDIANLSVSILPTIAFICIFAFAYATSVLGEFYFKAGSNLVAYVKGAQAPYLSLSYLDWDFAISLAGGFLIAFFGFSFLLNKNHARAVLLQPKKRTRIFNEKAFLPLVILSLVIILIKLCALAINFKYTTLPDGYIAPFIANTLISLVNLFWGFMCGTIAPIATSRKTEALLGGAALVVLPYSVICITNFSAMAFLRGYTLNDFTNLENLTFLDPIREFSFNSFTYFSAPFKPAGSSLAHSIIWMALSVAGLLLIKGYFKKNYKFEDCGLVNKNKLITFITSFSLPAVLSSVITEELFYAIYRNNLFVDTRMRNRLSGSFESLTFKEKLLIVATFLVVAVALSILLNVITTTKVVNYKEKVKPVLAITGVLFLTSLLSLSGGFGYEKKLPKAEDIETIEIYTPYDLVENNNEYIGTSDYYDVHSSVLRDAVTFENAEDIELILDIHSTIISEKEHETTEGLRLLYKLKDGSILVRNYQYISKDCAEEILRLWNTKEIKDIYKTILLNDSSAKSDEFNYSSWGSQIAETTGALYIHAKDGAFTSIREQLSDEEFNELKEMLFKDISSLAHYEWFKPTESYGLLVFDKDAIESSEHNIYTFGTISFQITKEMTHTVEFLKSHDLFKYFENNIEPEMAYVIDVNELGDWSIDYIKQIGSTYDNSVYPMNHRMMFTTETTASNYFYFEKTKALTNGYLPEAKELTYEEYKDYIKNSHIKYFSGEDGKILIVHYPERNAAQTFILP